jgi:hypothetical protein
MRAVHLHKKVMNVCCKANQQSQCTASATAQKENGKIQIFGFWEWWRNLERTLEPCLFNLRDLLPGT